MWAGEGELTVSGTTSSEEKITGFAYLIQVEVFPPEKLPFILYYFL